MLFNARIGTLIAAVNDMLVELSHPEAMKNKLAFICLMCVTGSLAEANELVYQGTWNTTNRKLDGVMTCVVTRISQNKWQGRFYGEWQGLAFDYTVKLSRPADELRGKAIIDGDTYDWKGWITPQQFKATFGGDRYTGSFDLHRIKMPKKLMTDAKPN